MAKHDLTLLGGLVAVHAISFDQAKSLTELCDHVDVQCVLPISLEAAIDNALDFFNDAPDVEAAETALRIAEAHDADTCPDCGSPMCEDGPDDHDFEQALDLWAAVRAIADKYAFDRRDFADGPGGRDIEEC